MPELPEVETTCRGITPHISNKKVTQVTIRQPSLRWPIPDDLADQITHRKVLNIRRRGKYLVFQFSHGVMLIHLGMSGSLRILKSATAVLKHDHVDIHFGRHGILRFNDPRRFGAVLWTSQALEEHPLIQHLGPEPLTACFDGDYLYQHSRKRKVALKSWIMNSHVVVGVGNIYANEALFIAGIHPLKAAGKITRAQANALSDAIKTILTYAIERGGTTLKDFVGSDGKPGYFAQELRVYGRGDAPCLQCGKTLIEKRISQRSTVYCSQCQH